MTTTQSHLVIAHAVFRRRLFLVDLRLRNVISNYTTTRIANNGVSYVK